MLNTNADIVYQELLKDVLFNGADREDRTGTGTISKFGVSAKFDISTVFPLLTIKKVPFGLIKSELFWFLRGDTTLRYLVQHNNDIWLEWGIKQWFESDDYKGPDMTNFGQRVKTDEEFRQQYEAQVNIYKAKVLIDDEFNNTYGNLGNIYGKQWRRWGDREFDQIQNVINLLREDPYTRRAVVSAWNAEDVQNAGTSEGTSALPPCHTLFQFYVSNDKLSCNLYQRSADLFLGSPFNIASYSLLTRLIADELGLGCGEFIYTIGDAHIYKDHIQQVVEVLRRKPQFKKPILSINYYEPEQGTGRKKKSIFELDVEDVTIKNYYPLPTIKAPVSV